MRRNSAYERIMISIFGLAFAGTVMLLVYGWISGNAEYSVERNFTVNRDSLWCFISRPAFRTMWQPALTGIVALEEPVDGSPQRFLLTFRKSGENWEIEEVLGHVAPPTLWMATHDSDRFQAALRFEVGGAGESSRLRYFERIEFKGFFDRALAPFLAFGRRSEMKSAFERLSEVVEARPACA